MNRQVFRRCLPLFLLALSSSVAAIGLGELRGQPRLGDRLRLDVEIIGAEKSSLDANCFSLIRPSDDGDLPWLSKGSISLRSGHPIVLEIRSNVPLREPVLQVALAIGCGYDISREYTLLASPEIAAFQGAKLSESAVVEPVAPPSLGTASKRASAGGRKAEGERISAPPIREMARRPPKLRQALPDRLMLSGGGEVGEPSLRLATELSINGGGIGAASEAQREILRLEFRMLLALQEQATTQLATAQKLRDMEGTLGELQQRAKDVGERIERGATISTAPPAPVESKQSAPSGVGGIVSTPPAEKGGGISEWSLYGVLIGALCGVGVWFGWRTYSERHRIDAASRFHSLAPAIDVPSRQERLESGSEAEVDLPFEESGQGQSMQVDVELDLEPPNQEGFATSDAESVQKPFESPNSVAFATVDEHFEANPVMELADIMLSFGRVKGAAQALQEYIDSNPQEALQPWIRLMDVYRMAGMRDEFEAVARNLNQHFNVEVQHWDGLSPVEALSEDEKGVQGAPGSRPQSIEDMPRIINQIIDLWSSGDVVGYMYQLLRDNRGGQRLGFALPVVEEILFLIELKETSKRFDENGQSR